MPKASQTEITQYVQAHIPGFHKAKLESLKGLPLLKVLSRKNPYLMIEFSGPSTTRELVEKILAAHLSSQEESVLGGFLEDLAVFVCKKAYKAHSKSTTTGLDLEFDKDGKRCLVAIKSRPSWGNSAQIAQMRTNFKSAVKVYRQNKNALPVLCVKGCCYGKQARKREEKGDYVELRGQRFWEFISGDTLLYIRIVELIGHMATERNEEFLAQYELVVDDFTELFRKHFCDARNLIIWDALVRHSSQEPVLKLKKRAKNPN